MIDHQPGLSAALLMQALGAKLSAELDPQIVFTSVTDNSAEVSPGALFVAVSGTARDGHAFAAQALKAGALAIVSDNAVKSEGLPTLLVPNVRQALSRLGYLFSDQAADAVHTIAITGTNGKTTINWIIYELLRSLGRKAVRVGTLGISPSELVAEQIALTTPGALDMHKLLAEARRVGVNHLVTEASSHALDQNRIDDLKVDLALFTNLTRDHLDYHGDMHSYYHAKRRLFEICASNAAGMKSAIINIDCDCGAKLQKEVAEFGLNDFSIGATEHATIRINDFSQSFSGSEVSLLFKQKSYTLRTRFIGKHNAYNLAAAFAAGVALGVAPQLLSEKLATIPQVPGRLESVPVGDRGIFVDYAHTPDALENVLNALRPLTRGRLWVLFGCGGDRDRGKRPQMAELASKLADRVVVTSDNPRTEEPQQIINDILSTGALVAFTEVDRRKAIYATLAASEPGDIVLIAGKGHEDYQIIGTTKTHFSDVEEVNAALQSLNMTRGKG